MEIFILSIILIVPIQLACCHSKIFLIKLLPMAGMFAFLIYYIMKQNPDPHCGLGDSIMGIFLIVFLGGIALGWIIYGIQVSKVKNNDKE